MNILQSILKADVLEIFVFFAILFLKVTIVFLAATIVTLLMKKGSAAARHFVWTLAFFVVLMLPLSMLFVPAFHVSVPGFPFLESAPVNTERSIERGSVKSPDSMLPVADNSSRSEDLSSSDDRHGQKEDAGKQSNETHAASSGLRIGAILQKIGPWFFVGFWGLGIAAFLAKQIIARLNLLRYGLRSIEVTDPAWIQELKNLKEQVGIFRRVRLLQSDRSTMVMTWGWFKPRILIPCTASGWTEDHRRFVLMHEMAHIRRLDTLTQLLVQVVLGLYWFHPLTWTSRRSFFREREHACDDFVLQQGSKPSEYAGLLLDIARTLSHFSFANTATVSMARKTQLEGRLLAILNSRKKRQAVKGRIVWVSCLVSICLVIPLAAIQPARDMPSMSVGTAQRFVSSPIVPASFPEATKTLDQEKTAANIMQDEEIKPGESIHTVAVNHPGNDSSSNKKRQTQDKKSTQKRKQLIQSLSETLQDPDLEVRIQAAETLGRLKDGASADALIVALGDEHGRMRLAVVEALGNIESSKAVDPLILALKDEDWRIRSEAVSALGDLGDERAVDPLAVMLKDIVPDVRMEAVEALSEIDDDRAAEALVQALSDEEWEIRKEAAIELGDVGNHRTVDPLILRLKEDKHWEVQRAAVESLGEIEDRRAIPALIEVTRSSRWEIRKAAVEALDDIGDPSVIDALIVCFQDSQVEVRKAAVDAAGDLENSRAMQPLMAMINDQDWEVRKHVVEALSEIDDPEAVPALVAAIGDEHREVRISIIEALGELEDRSAVEPLLGMLDHPEWEIRKVVVEALGDIGDPRVLELLTLRLKDDHEDVRKAAAHALGDLDWRQDN